MDAPKALYVLEWSPAQRAFHIESLAELVTNNMVRFVETVRQRDSYWPTFHPIAVFGTREEANMAGQALVNMRDDPPTRPGPEIWPA